MGDRFVKTRHHRVFDRYVRKITGGLTIFAPGKGQWVNPENDELVEERIIPEAELRKIVKFTIKHYDQDALMFYKVSDDVFIISRGEENFGC
jgi:hypothetical protein